MRNEIRQINETGKVKDRRENCQGVKVAEMERVGGEKKPVWRREGGREGRRERKGWFLD